MNGPKLEHWDVRSLWQLERETQRSKSTTKTKNGVISAVIWHQGPGRSSHSSNWGRKPASNWAANTTCGGFSRSQVSFHSQCNPPLVKMHKWQQLELRECSHRSNPHSPAKSDVSWRPTGHWKPSRRLALAKAENPSFIFGGTTTLNMGGWSAVHNFSLHGRDEENTSEDSMKEWNKRNISAQLLCQNQGKGNITYKQGAGEEQRLRWAGTGGWGSGNVEEMDPINNE